MAERKQLARFLGSISQTAQRSPGIVISAWVILAAVLTVFAPSLDEVIERTAKPLLPGDAPSTEGFLVMDEEFGSGKSKALSTILIVNENGLNEEDMETYTSLVTSLKAKPEFVAEVQDYLNNEDLQAALTSEDGKATYVTVGMTGEAGTPPAEEQVDWLRELTENTPKSESTEVYLNGSAVQLSDLADTLLATEHQTTIVSLAMLLLILLVIYRKPVTILVPLAVIGVALQVTRGLLGVLGMSGLPVSSYTASFVVAICLGAGTDYCMFLISRFRDTYRDRGPSTPNAVDAAVTSAVFRVGPALVASGATVMVAALCMTLTTLSMFSTTGPGMALCVFITVSVALTLGPALLQLLGNRIGPSKATDDNSRWHRLGDYVASRPRAALGIALVPMLLLALLAPMMNMTFSGKDSDVSGLVRTPATAALAKHFPNSAATPDVVIVKTKEPLNNTRALTAVNELSTAVLAADGIERVNSITQPTGEPIEAAQVVNQLESISDGFTEAQSGLSSGGTQLKQIEQAAKSIGPSFKSLSTQAREASTSLGELSTSMGDVSSGLNKTSRDVGQTANDLSDLAIIAGVAASGLQSGYVNFEATVSGLKPIIQTLKLSNGCSGDPDCVQARKDLEAIQETQEKQLLPALRDAAKSAREISDGSSAVAKDLRSLRKSIDETAGGTSGVQDSAAEIQGNLTEAATITGDIANTADEVGPQAKTYLKQFKKLIKGLGDAQSFLDEASSDGSSLSTGFYLPGSALEKDDFGVARALFLGGDNGSTTRIQAVPDPETKFKPRQRFASIMKQVEGALPGSALDGAEVYYTGAGAFEYDLATYSARDGRIVMAAAILVIFFILVFSLRALVAPVYLLFSVVLSSAAALGLTVLIWQFMIGQPIHFTVPAMTFVVLVAVGADYNIILMSRLRELGAVVDRTAVAKAVASTGPVISSAGIIFAATFVALISAPVLALQEIGVAVSLGLLMDAFIVRGMIVPAFAALCGRYNWWPWGNDQEALERVDYERARRARPGTVQPGQAPTAFAADWIASSRPRASEDEDPDRPHAGANTR